MKAAHSEPLKFSAIQKALFRIHAVLSGLAQILAFLSAVLLVLMVCHVLIEIILRNIFFSSTYVLDEFVGYAVAAITFNSLGYALERDALIRVNLLLSAVSRSPRIVGVLEHIAVVLTLAVVGLAGYQFFWSIVRSYNRGATSETVAEVPMWMPETLMLVGLTAFWLLLFSRFACMIAGLTKQELERNVNRKLFTGSILSARG